MEGRHPPARHAELLAAMGACYARVLESPIERIRACLTLHRPEHWVTGGEPGLDAPYFTALVLQGRPVEQRHRLLAELTDVLVDVLGVRRELVRGRVVPVDPDDWGIGGLPASRARAAEIAARAVDSS